jgi:hypothetical protein
VKDNGAQVRAVAFLVELSSQQALYSAILCRSMLRKTEEEVLLAMQTPGYVEPAPLLLWIVFGEGAWVESNTNRSDEEIRKIKIDWSAKVLVNFPFPSIFYLDI